MMTEKQHLTCDLLIVGAGFAGMVAAARASALGIKTIQLGKSSDLFLISGLFDLLGVLPGDSKKIIQDPRDGFKELSLSVPDHPYMKTTFKSVCESFDFLMTFLKSAGLIYRSNSGGNYSVLTSAGTFKPTWLIPETFSGCQKLRKKSTRLLLLDFKGLRGFSAKQISGMIADEIPAVTTLTIDIPWIKGGLNPTQLAHLFEDPQFLNHVSRQILPLSGQVDLVGLPAVCGVQNSLDIIQTLGKETGLDFFEIPGLPPSIPGLRLKQAFEKKLSQQHVTFLNKAVVKSSRFEDQTFTIEAETQSMESRIQAKGVILATGRFPGGGLHAKRDVIHETVFNLPVFQPDHRNKWHQLDFFDRQGHLINQAGLETDSFFRPADSTDHPVFEHLYAIGSILAHNDWVRLKCGSGVSCVSAFHAVNHFNDTFMKGAHV